MNRIPEDSENSSNNSAESQKSVAGTSKINHEEKADKNKPAKIEDHTLTSDERREYFQISVQEQINEVLRLNSLYTLGAPDEETIENMPYFHEENVNNNGTSYHNAVLNSGRPDTILGKAIAHQFPLTRERQSVLCSAAPDQQSTTSAVHSEDLMMAKPTSCKTTQREFLVDDSNSFCKNCVRLIILNGDLMGSLVKEVKRPSKSHPDSTITDFWCRICDRHLREGFIKHHLENHKNAKELYYCLKCQRQINNISIEPYPEPKKRQIMKRDTFYPLIETKKVELQGVAPPDPLIEPHCGKCGRIFDYIGPLIHKIVDSSVKVFLTPNGSISATGCYICCLCERDESSLHTMQYHVSLHIQHGDVNCKICKLENPSNEQVAQKS